MISLSLKDIDHLVAVARATGVAILKHRGIGAVERKADASPVTAADRAGEDVAVAGIRALTEGFPVVAEEAAAAAAPPAIGAGPFWLVDALDGTKEFVAGRAEFTVNLALIENGRPAFGVVHAPALGATYWGSRNGAFADTGGGAKRIAVRAVPADGMVAVVSRSHYTPEVGAYLKAFRIKKEIGAGSSLKFCQIASGKADIYPRLGRTMEWDTAAGHAVVRFAGGLVNDLAGSELVYGKPAFENPAFVVSGQPLA